MTLHFNVCEYCTHLTGRPSYQPSDEEVKCLLTTTFTKLREANACVPRYHHLAKALGGITKYGKDTPIPLLAILDHNGLSDAVWALRATIEDESVIARTFACECAERVLPLFESKYPDDDRPRKAIETARAYIAGEVAQEQLSAVESAAVSAARSAAWSEAESAAESAAWSAAVSAAATAAESAAVSAARSEAESAVGSAARSAQEKILRKLLSGVVKGTDNDQRYL